MGALIRQYDWSASVLSTPERWAPSLITTLGIMLHTPVPMFLWWGPNLIQFYNDAYCPRLAHIGKHPNALGQRGAVCWPEVWSTIRLLIDQVLAGNDMIASETEWLPMPRNGQAGNGYRPLSYSPVWNQSGQVAGVLGIGHATPALVTGMARAVTRNAEAPHRLEASAAYLQRVFRHTAVGIYITKEPDLVIEMANPVMCAFWGRTETQLVGLSFFDALPEIPTPAFEAAIAGIRQLGQPFIGREIMDTVSRHGQSHIRYVDVVAEPLFDADGRMSRIVHTVMDVTERVVARQLIEQLLTRERELNELKSNFVALASHEFRTPMTTILSSAGLIRRYNGGNDGANRDRHVQRIESAVDGLTDLLDDFLSLSQMEQQTLFSHPYPLHIGLLCEEVIDDMRGILKPGQRVVYRHLAGESEILVDGHCSICKGWPYPCKTAAFIVVGIIVGLLIVRR